MDEHTVRSETSPIKRKCGRNACVLRVKDGAHLRHHARLFKQVVDDAPAERHAFEESIIHQNTGVQFFILDSSVFWLGPPAPIGAGIR